MTLTACDPCLRRAWLMAELSGHLDCIRAELGPVLALSDHDLIDAVAGRRAQAITTAWTEFDPGTVRARIAAAETEAVCRCEPEYPDGLGALAAPPAVLFVAGDPARLRELAAEPAVALVGSRRASGYGTGVAHDLAAGLAAAGVPVVSGMALGIDCAAHTGALTRGGLTVAVLPGGTDQVYPPARRALHGEILAAGLIVSELPPGTPPRRWTFPARNRTIAGLSDATVVVEAAHRSGALITARIAREIGRPVGAVPGRVGTAQARGPNALLAGGAVVIRDPQDVLDLLYGEGVRSADAAREPVDPELRALWEAIAGGADTMASLARAGVSPAGGLAALAALELEGLIRREPGGRFSIVS